jgi:hypothetical protein
MVANACQAWIHEEVMGVIALPLPRIVASAFFAREILDGRVDCADLVILLRFEEVP